MNIQEAKEQIEKAVRIYLMKDEYGDYRIPIERQRPVFLLGAPVSEKLLLWSRSHRRWISHWCPIP
mgnify:CR=1 FL=1